MVWLSILAGMGAGIAYSLTAWAKKEGQAFDWIKFGTTVAIGACIGLLQFVFKTPLDLGLQAMMNVGATAVVENIIKIAIRKIWVPVVDFFVKPK